MPSIITNLCLREGLCVTVCPADCIVPGKPVEQYPQYYIDPDSCIDCGSCIPVCPHGAIFTDDQIPTAFQAQGGEILCMPVGTPGFTETYDGINQQGKEVHLPAVRRLAAGEIVDLSDSAQVNAAFFSEGPGYEVLLDES